MASKNYKCPKCGTDLVMNKGLKLKATASTSLPLQQPQHTSGNNGHKDIWDIERDKITVIALKHGLSLPVRGDIWYRLCKCLKCGNPAIATWRKDPMVFPPKVLIGKIIAEERVGGNRRPRYSTMCIDPECKSRVFGSFIFKEGVWVTMVPGTPAEIKNPARS